MQKMAYSIKEAAALLGVSKGSITTEIRRGNLPIKRFGRRVLILVTDFETYLSKLPEREPKEATHVGL